MDNWQRKRLWLRLLQKEIRDHDLQGIDIAAEQVKIELKVSGLSRSRRDSVIRCAELTRKIVRIEEEERAEG